MSTDDHLAKLYAASKKVLDGYPKDYLSGTQFSFKLDKENRPVVRHAQLYAGGWFVVDTSCDWAWPILEYMAAACNAVPELLAEREELHRQLDEARKKIRQLTPSVSTLNGTMRPV